MQTDTARERLLALSAVAKSAASVSQVLDFSAKEIITRPKKNIPLTLACFIFRHRSRTHRRHHFTGHQDCSGTRTSYPSKRQGERQSSTTISFTLCHSQDSVHLHLRIRQRQQDGRSATSHGRCCIPSWIWHTDPREPPKRTAHGPRESH